MAVKVGVFAVGFALGWFWRGWRDRVLCEEEFKKRGIDPNDL
jgi:hypothetical protein